MAYPQGQGDCPSSGTNVNRLQRKGAAAALLHDENLLDLGSARHRVDNGQLDVVILQRHGYSHSKFSHFTFPSLSFKY